MESINHTNRIPDHNCYAPARTWKWNFLDEHRTSKSLFGDISSISVNSSSSHLMSASKSGDIYFWNLRATQGTLPKRINGHNGAIRQISSLNEDVLISCGRDKTIKFWSLTSQQLLFELSGHKSSVDLFSISPCRKYLASYESNGQFYIWDIFNKNCIGIVDSIVESSAIAILFEQSGHIYICYKNGNITLLDWQDKSENVIITCESEFRKAVFDQCGIFVATTDQQGQIIVWNIEERKQAYSLKGHSKQITSLVFSPDCKLLASAGLEKKIHIWCMETGDLTRNFPCGHKSAITALGFSPDSRLLLSGGADNLLNMWWCTRTVFQKPSNFQVKPKYLFSLYLSSLFLLIAIGGLRDGFSLWILLFLGWLVFVIFKSIIHAFYIQSLIDTGKYSNILKINDMALENNTEIPSLIYKQLGDYNCGIHLTSLELIQCKQTNKMIEKQKAREARSRFLGSLGVSVFKVVTGLAIEESSSAVGDLFGYQKVDSYTRHSSGAQVDSYWRRKPK